MSKRCEDKDKINAILCIIVFYNAQRAQLSLTSYFNDGAFDSQRGLQTCGTIVLFCFPIMYGSLKENALAFVPTFV